MADEVHVHGGEMLEWTHDFAKLEKQFGDDSGDILDGSGKHVRYGTNSKITEYVDQIHDPSMGGANLPEVTYLVQTARAYLGNPRAGVVGYLNVVRDGLASHRKMVEVAAAEYGNNEVYGQKEFDKVDQSILEKTGVGFDHPGYYVSTVIVVKAEPDVAGRSTLPTTDPPAASDWDHIEYPQVLWTIWGVKDEPLTNLATGFGVIGTHLLTYSSRLQDRVGLVTRPKIWAGDAAKAFDGASDEAAASMSEWSVKLQNLTQMLGRAAHSIRTARESAEQALTDYRNDIDALTEMWNKHIEYAQLNGSWMGKSPQELMDKYRDKAQDRENEFAKRLRQIGREMSEGIVANSSWRPLPQPYQGLMLEAVLKPHKPRPETKKPTGPGANPGAGPNAQQKPKNGFQERSVPWPRGGLPDDKKNKPGDNKNKPGDNKNKPGNNKGGKTHGANTQDPNPNTNGNTNNTKPTDTPGTNTPGTTPGTTPGSTPGNSPVGGVTAPTIPTLPGSGTTTPGTGTGVVVPTIPTIPTTGGTTTPNTGGGKPGTTIPITPGNGNGTNPGSSARPNWWDDNPWNNPSSPVSLDGRNTAGPNGGGGGGGGKNTPVTPIEPIDPGPTPTTNTPINGGTGTPAESTPFLPPMGGMGGGAGGGGGGGGPRPVRRGGPKLVDPGVGNGPAALTGRGKDANADKPKVVASETVGWTQPPAPEVTEQEPATHVYRTA
ncbi:hypothetical protein AB0M47_14385 [Hamadaea sp. NPDC051192]|uniref:WXG100 family type VII secretion target n=1 Tax=Hamadaea sp. NPDC051192 TaxID=3154940 RepID=UPI0034137D67